MPKQLDYTVKIDAKTGEFVGADAERMIESLRKHYGGQFVNISVFGIVAGVKELRGYYFVSMIPHFLTALQNAGYDVEPENKVHRKAAHEKIKELFIDVEDGEEPSTKDFTTEDWRIFLRRIEHYLDTNFDYKLRKNEH